MQKSHLRQFMFSFTKPDVENGLMIRQTPDSTLQLSLLKCSLSQRLLKSLVALGISTRDQSVCVSTSPSDLFISLFQLLNVW